MPSVAREGEKTEQLIYNSCKASFEIVKGEAGISLTLLPGFGHFQLIGLPCLTSIEDMPLDMPWMLDLYGGSPFLKRREGGVDGEKKGRIGRGEGGEDAIRM